MKQIALTKVIISNFRSYHGIAVDVSTEAGLKMLTGRNLVEPRLGANGCGKSSFWEAVVWCFYGSGVAGDKVSALLSWNEKLAEVLTEVSINQEIHEIYRSGPPVRIELDGQPATQDQVDELLGLSKEQFVNSVIFGQDVPLFPDLPVPERSKILDEVLKLEIWHRASELATQKMNQFEKQITDLQIHLSSVEGRLQQLQDEKHLETESQQWEDEQRKEIEKIQNESLEWELTKQRRVEGIQELINVWRADSQKLRADVLTDIDSLERQIATNEDLIRETPDLAAQVITLNLHLEKDRESIQNLRATHREFEVRKAITIKPKKMWEVHSNCPTCDQPLSQELKDAELARINAAEKDLQDSMDLVATNMGKLEEEVRQKSSALAFLQQQEKDNLKQLAVYNTEIQSKQKAIDSYERQVASITKQLQNDAHPYANQLKYAESETNPFTSRIEKMVNEKNPYLDLITKNRTARKELISKKAYYTEAISEADKKSIATEYWKHGFKRIRLYFIEQVLGALQIEVGSALSSLGLVGWTAEITTETENKSGGTKLGVQVMIKSPSARAELSVWSGGEKQRLRLGIAMGLASLIQRSCGVYYTLEVWDEPSAWLSSEGIEDLLDALQHRSSSMKKSIWIVDHRALQFSGFSEIWMVTKDKDGSSISLHSQEA